MEKIKATIELTAAEWKLLHDGLGCNAQESTTNEDEKLNLDLQVDLGRQLAAQSLDVTQPRPLSRT